MISLRRVLAYWLLMTAIPIPSGGQSTATPPAYKPAASADEAVKRIEELGGTVRKLALAGDAIEVDLRGSSVNDVQLQYLLVLKNVAVVRLRECAVGDAGLVHLGKIAGLKRLHLEKTTVSDVGLKHLAGLKELEVLNLYGCTIGDAGLTHMAALTNLRSLFVSETKATEAGIATLRKALPKLAVIPDRALERQRAEAAWETTKKALAEMEVRFQAAKKDADLLTPRVAELKKKLDEATKKLNDAKSKADGSSAVNEAQAVLKVAQQEHSRAANAAKDFQLAQKHLEAYRQLEAEARSRVELLRSK